MCNCTSENLEIPGSHLSMRPGMTAGIASLPGLLMMRRFAVELTHCSSKNRTVKLRHPTAILSNSNIKQKGRCAMTRTDFGSLPRGNPCAQCGKPIAVPEWVEAESGRVSYLWRCQTCDYR